MKYFSMNLELSQQIRDTIAKRLSLDNWKSVERLFEKNKLSVKEFNQLVNTAMQLYASSNQKIQREIGYRKVSVEERLPEKEKRYIVQQSSWEHETILKYYPDLKRWENNIEDIEWWLEEVTPSKQFDIKKLDTKYLLLWIDEQKQEWIDAFQPFTKKPDSLFVFIDSLKIKILSLQENIEVKVDNEALKFHGQCLAHPKGKLPQFC